MEFDGMLRIFNRSEKLHNLKYSNYIGDGDTKTFNALSENKPYGDDYLIQKIECVGYVQMRMGTRLRKLILVYSKKKLSDGKTIGGKGRLTDSLIDKLAHYYGNAIRCNSTSVKEMRKAIWAVFGVILAALMMNRCTGFVLQIQIHGIAEIAANLATSVFNDGNQILISILEKFGLKINRNVCVSLAERDNRRSLRHDRGVYSHLLKLAEPRKLKRVKKVSCFRNRKRYKTLNCNKTTMYYSIDMHFFYSKDNLVELHFNNDFWHMTATAGSDVVQSGRLIFDDFFQHLWPYIGNNTANVVFQMVKRL
ncbi:uncharacterized protein TNCV_3271381 [Trichonephila clavipes]|nr:uncharacterized protein TNCV_3271381 [Trichonephila clavipes]